jgi:hypothetical protein
MLDRQVAHSLGFVVICLGSKFNKPQYYCTNAAKLILGFFQHLFYVQFVGTGFSLKFFSADGWMVGGCQSMLAVFLITCFNNNTAIFQQEGTLQYNKMIDEICMSQTQLAIFSDFVM